MALPFANVAVWSVAILATAGVIVRPFRLPEAIWAVAGAALLVVFGLLPAPEALAAVERGTDVYLFLAGMMLLSEIARREGLFDWAAAWAVRAANGSAQRLFVIIYGVGVIVTVVLSNDATAVVLTPAVYAATKKARVDPLPYLLICAFVANAASFVLPISNPANLVVYGEHMPALGAWLSRFLLPSVFAVGATFLALRIAERERIGNALATDTAPPPLSAGGKTVLAAIGLTAVTLVSVSAFGLALGLPTVVMGFATLAVVVATRRQPVWQFVNEISWSVLPLVAGLFVLVEGLFRAGVVSSLARAIDCVASENPETAAWLSGALVAIGSNLMNNLPAGLIASSALAQAHAPQSVTDSILIGVDLGPNLSVTGSLATILWLAAIRREGESVSFWRFLKVGVFVMPPALGLALAARLAPG
jgi:arsenical pump membrane protein